MTSINEVQLERFFSYLTARHAAYFVRPSSDPIIARNHFTNVYRELDKGTRYMIDTIPSTKPLWWIVAYRAINRQEVFEEYNGEWRVSSWLQYIDDRYAAGKCVKTSRHLTPHRRQYRAAVVEAELCSVTRVKREAFKAVCSLTGIGQFIGWQIVADLEMVGVVDADDTFVRVGDGAAYAIAMLYDVAAVTQYRHGIFRVRPSAAQSKKCEEVVLWLVRIQKEKCSLPWISPSNMEHSLCEWLRYEKYRAGVR